MIQTVFLVYDDYNSKLYDHADYIGTVTAHGSGCLKALRNGIKIIEVKIDDKDTGIRRRKLTSVAKDNMILEIMEDDDNEQTV